MQQYYFKATHAEDHEFCSDIIIYADYKNVAKYKKKA